MRREIVDQPSCNVAGTTISSSEASSAAARVNTDSTLSCPGDVNGSALSPSDEVDDEVDNGDAAGANTAASVRLCRRAA